MESGNYLIVLSVEWRHVRFWRDIFSEFVGTFVLVGSYCLLSIDWSTEPDPQESLARVGAWAAAGNALVIVCLVWVFWEFGGAHMNPAVTFAFAIALRITFHKAFWYIGVQIVASLLAAAFIQAVTPKSELRPKYWLPRLTTELSIWQCYAIELFCSFIFVITYLSSTYHHRKLTRISPCLMIGCAAGASTMIAHWTIGAFVNPVKALGPALLWRSFDNQTLYWLGPLSGALVASFVYFACLEPLDTAANASSRDHRSLSTGVLRIGRHVIQYQAANSSSESSPGHPSVIPATVCGSKQCYANRKLGLEELFLG